MEHQVGEHHGLTDPEVGTPVDYRAADSQWVSQYAISAVDEYGVTLCKEGVPNILLSRRTFLVHEGLVWRRSESELSHSAEEEVAATGEDSKHDLVNAEILLRRSESESSPSGVEGVSETGETSIEEGNVSNAVERHDFLEEEDEEEAVGASLEGGGPFVPGLPLEDPGGRLSPPPPAPSIRRRYARLFLSGETGDFAYITQPGGHYLDPESASVAVRDEVEDEAGRIQKAINGTYHLPTFIRLPHGTKVSDIIFWRKNSRYRAYIQIGVDADDESTLKAIPYPVNVPKRDFPRDEKLVPAHGTVPRPEFQPGTNVLCFLNEDEISFAKVAHSSARFNRYENGIFDRYEYSLNAVEEKKSIHNSLADQLFRIYHEGEVLLYRRGTEMNLAVVKSVTVWTIECDVLEDISVPSAPPVVPIFSWLTRTICVHDRLFSVTSQTIFSLIMYVPYYNVSFGFAILHTGNPYVDFF